MFDNESRSIYDSVHAIVLVRVHECDGKSEEIIQYVLSHLSVGFFVTAATIAQHIRKDGLHCSTNTRPFILTYIYQTKSLLTGASRGMETGAFLGAAFLGAAFLATGAFPTARVAMVGPVKADAELTRARMEATASFILIILRRVEYMRVLVRSDERDGACRERNSEIKISLKKACTLTHDVKKDRR